MSLSLYTDTSPTDLEAQDPWAQPITVYQPYVVEHILLPDEANCLALQTFLKMCEIKFEIESRVNAEYMSPSGRVPFIKCGAFIVADFDNIVAFVGKKGRSLSSHLSGTCKADMRAFMSLVDNIFINAELYICWVDETTLHEITNPRHGRVYPWPLNHYLNWKKRREILKKLKILGWYKKTIDEVCNEVKNCCTILSEKLEGKEYFSGERPTEEDALVFGHIHALINSHLPKTVQEIIATIQQFPILLEHESRVNQNYLNNAAKSLLDMKLTESPSKDTLWNSSESFEVLPPLSEDSFEF